MAKFNIMDMASIDFSQSEYFYLKNGCSKQLTYIIRNIYNTGYSTAIQPGPIRLTSFGIPRIHEDYCPDDTRRGFIKIPIDVNQKSCSEFRDFLSRADDYFGSIEFKKKIFGSKYDRYEYQPMIRAPQEYDDDIRVCYKVENVNVKFMMKYDSNGIKTGETTTIIKNNNKILPTKTITDITKYIRFNTTINPTIIIHKIWAGKAPCPGAKFISYGVGLIVSEINIGQALNNYIDLSNPIYDLDGLKSAYKPFIDEKRIIINKHHTIIEV